MIETGKQLQDFLNMPVSTVGQSASSWSHLLTMSFIGAKVNKWTNQTDLLIVLNTLNTLATIGMPSARKSGLVNDRSKFDVMALL